MSEQRELTAMMELIEWVESNLITSNSVIAKATELLAKEKSQIEAAVNMTHDTMLTGEGCYSLTYKSEVK
jgi:hypothetical protein